MIDQAIFSRRRFIQMHPMGRKREAWRSSFFFFLGFCFGFLGPLSSFDYLFFRVC